MDFDRFNDILETGTRSQLEEFCQSNNLEIRGEYVYHKDPDVVTQSLMFWDKRQLVKKINLNS
jgi:hypothetical protein